MNHAGPGEIRATTVTGQQTRVLCTQRLPDDLLIPLTGTGIVAPAGSNGDLMSQAEVLAQVASVDAIINQAELRVDAELLEAAPRLRIVANIARGYDNLDLPLLTARGVWATNVPDAFAAPTAEVALGLMLMVMRRLAEGARCVRDGSWSDFEPGRWDGWTLDGKTLGLVGYGKIARATARRAEAFGMTVIHHRRTPEATGAAGWRPLPDLLREADVVSLHVPATPETFHLIDTAALALMKSGAILINTARGSVVDETALIAALTRGHLAGAGLDVTEHEPKVPAALHQMPNVVITPHLGGGTRESRQAARHLAVTNVAAVLRGQRPQAALNDIAD